jgi:YVTN family beta-propeller protein
MTALWGDDASPTALRTLQSHVFQLRRSLATSGAAEEATGSAEVPSDDAWSIETDGRGYRLRIDAEGIDARRFEHLLGEAQAKARDEPRAGITALVRALELWRGPDLPDVGGEAIATAELERLVELRHGAFDELVRQRIALGEATDVIPELRRELRSYPYREPLWGSLMLALDASGRKAEALLAYREATAALRQELDVEPDAELRMLADRIRDGSNPRPVAPAPTLTVRDPSDRAPVEPPSARVDAGSTERATGPRRRVRSRGVWAAGVLGLVLLLLVAAQLLPASGGRGTGAQQADPSASGAATDGVALLDATGRQTASTPIGARPAGIASGAGSLWVSSPTDGTVLRVDPVSHTVIQRIAVGGGPAGIALGVRGDLGRRQQRSFRIADRPHDRPGRGDRRRGDRTRGRRHGQPLGMGDGPARPCTDPHRPHGWIIPLVRHRCDPTGRGRRRGWVWVVDGGSSSVAQVDPATGTVVHTVGVGDDPTAIAASPDGDALWVANTESGTVFRIDTSTSAVTAAQTVGTAPTGVAVDAQNVWVAVSGSDEVVRLDRRPPR